MSAVGAAAELLLHGRARIAVRSMDMAVHLPPLISPDITLFCSLDHTTESLALHNTVKRVLASQNVPGGQIGSES